MRCPSRLATPTRRGISKPWSDLLPRCPQASRNDRMTTKGSKGERMHRIGALAFAVLLFAGCSAAAQDSYPSQLVKLVVPSAAGSTTDTLARIVADQLSR